MIRENMPCVVAVSACAMLAIACSPRDDEGSSAFCQMLGGGNATVSTMTSAGANFGDAGKAFDGDLESFATLATSGDSGGTIRGTAQPGVAAVAGAIAGLAVTTPQNGTYTVTIKTYSSGALQESQLVNTETYAGGSSTSRSCGGTCVTRSDGLSFYGMETTKVFNAIEAVIGINNGTPALQIRELCLRQK